MGSSQMLTFWMKKTSQWLSRWSSKADQVLTWHMRLARFSLAMFRPLILLTIGHRYSNKQATLITLLMLGLDIFISLATNHKQFKTVRQTSESTRCPVT